MANSAYAQEAFLPAAFSPTERPKIAYLDRGPQYDNQWAVGVLVACGDPESMEQIWKTPVAAASVGYVAEGDTFPQCIQGLFEFREVRVLRPIWDTRGNVAILIEIRWERLRVQTEDMIVLFAPGVPAASWMYTVRLPRPGELEP